MAKKRSKTLASSEEKKEVNYKIPEYMPTETRTAGFFYIKPNASGTWTLYFECKEDGKRKFIAVPERIYHYFGLRSDASLEKAREEIKKYNAGRKYAEVNNDIKKIRSVKRYEEILGFNKIYFPPDLTEEFLAKLLSASEGQKKFKARLTRCFQIVQEIVTTLKIRPHQYADDLDRIVSFAKEKQYSVAYTQDILYVMNKWGVFYSRKQQSYFEPISSLKAKTKNSISNEQKKKKGVRRTSIPMTLEVLSRVKQKISLSNPTSIKDLQRFNWLFITYSFGLRPSETDAVLEKPIFEKINGVDVLIVIQTKLTVVEEDEKIKKIPVISDEQEKAMHLIIKHKKTYNPNIKDSGCARRPPSKWVDMMCKDPNMAYTHLEKYDLYTSRKGFTDFIISKGQDLEKASIYCGHKNIQTTWKHYKDRKSVIFNPNSYIKRKNKTNMKSKNKGTSLGNVVELKPTGTDDPSKKNK